MVTSVVTVGRMVVDINPNTGMLVIAMKPTEDVRRERAHWNQRNEKRALRPMARPAPVTRETQ